MYIKYSVMSKYTCSIFLQGGDMYMQLSMTCPELVRQLSQLEVLAQLRVISEKW